MEVINLKSAITFRVDLNEKHHAFAAKAFRGKRGGTGTIPEPKEHVVFDVTDIAIDATDPWFTLAKPIRITVLWSNVISVQIEEVADLANVG